MALSMAASYSDPPRAPKPTAPLVTSWGGHHPSPVLSGRRAVGPHARRLFCTQPGLTPAHLPPLAESPMSNTAPYLWVRAR